MLLQNEQSKRVLFYGGAAALYYISLFKTTGYFLLSYYTTEIFLKEVIHNQSIGLTNVALLMLLFFLPVFIFKSLSC